MDTVIGTKPGRFPVLAFLAKQPAAIGPALWL